MKKSNLNDTINKFNIIHNNKYNYSLFTKYINIRQRIEIICPKHGIFSQKIGMHKIGQGCPDCKAEKIGNLTRFTIDEILMKFKKTHQDKYDYSLFTEYFNVDQHANIICKKHGLFKQTVRNHYNGQGCMKCYNEIRHTYLCDTKDNFIKKANIVHNNIYAYPFETYKNSKTKIEIECSIHGIFMKNPNSHLNGEGCPHCFSSNGEKKIYFILKGNKIRFITQKIFKDCKYINGLRFDFYLLEYNLCIEFNGQQHYEIVKHWGNESDLLKTIEKDKIKNDYCEMKGIKLLKIPYSEFDNIYEILKKNLNEKIKDFEIEGDVNLTYIESKKIVKELNIKTQTEYNKRYKEYLGLPSSPNGLYKKDWIGWREFLGTINTQLDKNYLSYNESKWWIKNNLSNIKSEKFWKLSVMKNKIPIFIPNNPKQFYQKKNRGWLGWMDFLNKLNTF